MRGAPKRNNRSMLSPRHERTDRMSRTTRQPGATCEMMPHCTRSLQLAPSDFGRNVPGILRGMVVGAIGECSARILASKRDTDSQVIQGVNPMLSIEQVNSRLHEEHIAAFAQQLRG